MKRLVGVSAIGLALLQGCASDGSSASGTSASNARGGNDAVVVASLPTGPGNSAVTTSTNATGDEVLARINGRAITMSQVRPTLLEAYGLNVLLNVVQLELAKNEAQKQGIKISSSDIEEEWHLTTERMFKGSDADSKLVGAIDAAELRKDTAEADQLRKQLKTDRERMLLQFLEQQKVSRPEFELVLQTNAYLRKIAEPQLQGRITEEALHTAFDAEFGAKVKVRHIQGNPADLETARRRILAGEKFEDVARQVSTNKKTAAVGGEMPAAFTLSNPGYPDQFKRLAFDLKPGEVSEVVAAGGTFHILQLIGDKIPPKAVKFESVRESLHARLYDAVLQAAVKQLRDVLAAQARTNLKIQEPVLRDQFQRKLDERDTMIKDQEKMRQEMERERIQGLKGVGVEPQSEEPSKTPAGPEKPDAVKPDAVKPDAVKPDAAKPDATKPPQPTKSDASKPDAKAAPAPTVDLDAAAPAPKPAATKK